MITGQSYQTNKHFVLELLTARNYKTAGKLQNNTVNGAMSITVNRMIIAEIIKMLIIIIMIITVIIIIIKIIVI